jgi:hypothetical protein
VQKLIDKAKANNVQIHLPVDFVTADKFAEDAAVGTGSLEAGIPDGWLGLDIGPKTRDLFREPIERAKVIVWNGYVLWYMQHLTVSHSFNHSMLHHCVIVRWSVWINITIYALVL